MNKILLLSLISFAISISDDLKGPAVNPKHSEGTEFCVTYFPWDEDSTMEKVIGMIITIQIFHKEFLIALIL